MCVERKLGVVMEYCSQESLYHIMNDRDCDLGWDKFFKFAIQMTKGVECLHNSAPQILHRNIKSSNILINETWDSKVADLFLMRAVAETSTVHPPICAMV